MKCMQYTCTYQQETIDIGCQDLETSCQRAKSTLKQVTSKKCLLTIYVSLSCWDFFGDIVNGA